MSRRFGKRKEENEYASEGDNPPKKASRTDDSDDEDAIVVCEISKNRRVTVRNFGGRVMVDIREFYVKDGKQMPGRKDRSTQIIPYWVDVGNSREMKNLQQHHIALEIF